MAANEAIIRAAGQRYAPQKIDYSGYIKGLASVASFLVAKKKAAISRMQNIDETIETATSSIEGSLLDSQAEEAIKKYRDLAYEAQKNMGGFHWTEKNKASKYSYNKAIESIEKIAKTTKKANDYLMSLKDNIREKNISDAYGAEMTSWFYDITDKEKGLKFIKIEDGDVKLLNHKGEHVSWDDIPKNIITKEDSEKFYKESVKNLGEYKKLKFDFERKWGSIDPQTKAEKDDRNVDLQELQTVMNDDIDAIANAIKSDNKILPSAAFDRQHTLADGTRVYFFDYYLSEESGMLDAKITKELNEEIEKMKEEGRSQEDILEFKRILAADIIEKGLDSDIEEDYLNFHKLLYRNSN